MDGDFGPRGTTFGIRAILIQPSFIRADFDFPFSGVSTRYGNNSGARDGRVQSQRQTGTVRIFVGLGGEPIRWTSKFNTAGSVIRISQCSTMIAPVIETFPMSRANEALEHLETGKARYRIVLENDLA
jgi:hypothetical protein